MKQHRFQNSIGSLACELNQRVHAQIILWSDSRLKFCKLRAKYLPLEKSFLGAFEKARPIDSQANQCVWATKLENRIAVFKTSFGK
jgi:hypothetical protein